MSDCEHITGCQYARMNLSTFRSMVMCTCSLQDLTMIKRQIDSLGDHANIFPDIEQRRQLIAEHWRHIEQGRLVVSVSH